MASSTADLHDGRLECPVCLGARMVKVRPEVAKPLVLDHCRRCGGIWFDAGEVGHLRRAAPQALWTHVTLDPEAFRMKCHRCHASFRRNEPRCLACGWENALRCPRDRSRLVRVERGGLTLDACRVCHGVWFDNVELAEIWNRSLDALVRRRADAAVPGTVDSDRFLLAAMFVDPYSVAIAGDAIAHAAGPALHVAGEAAGVAVDASGELASGVFGAIADLIAKVLEALGDL